MVIDTNVNFASSSSFLLVGTYKSLMQSTQHSIEQHFFVFFPFFKFDIFQFGIICDYERINSFVLVFIFLYGLQ